jgi:hypothetical protein
MPLAFALSSLPISYSLHQKLWQQAKDAVDIQGDKKEAQI